MTASLPPWPIPTTSAVATSLGTALTCTLATAVTGLATGETGTCSALFDDSGYAREAVSECQHDGGAVLHRDAASGLTFWLNSYGSWSDTDGDRSA